jgi:hypothetical protein
MQAVKAARRKAKEMAMKLDPIEIKVRHCLLRRAPTPSVLVLPRAPAPHSNNVPTTARTHTTTQVRAATNNDKWGASSTLMSEIAAATGNYDEHSKLFAMVRKSRRRSDNRPLSLPHFAAFL